MLSASIYKICAVADNVGVDTLGLIEAWYWAPSFGGCLPKEEKPPEEAGGVLSHFRKYRKCRP